jgi:hypothetical protein
MPGNLWKGLPGRGCSLLFSEKSLESSFGLFDPVGTSSPSLRSPKKKVIAKIGPLFIYDSLGQHFAACIVGVRVIELTLLTTSKRAVTVRTGVSSFYGANNVQTPAAKGAAHDVCFFDQPITPSPYISRLPGISSVLSKNGLKRAPQLRKYLFLFDAHICREFRLYSFPVRLGCGGLFQPHALANSFLDRCGISYSEKCRSRYTSEQQRPTLL